MRHCSGYDSLCLVWIRLVVGMKVIVGCEYSGIVRDAFLKRHLLHYDAVQYINNNLPTDAKIFTMFLGRRGYYIDREYKNESSFGMTTIKRMVYSSKDEETFEKFIDSMDVTHILMRTDLVYNYLNDNFSREEINRFMNFVKKYWKLLYEYNGHSVWYIRE